MLTTGLTTGNWYEIYPLTKVFEDLLSRDKETEMLYWLRDGGSVKRFNSISRELESMAEYPFFLTEMPKMTNRWFCNMLNLDPKTDWLTKYRTRIKETVEMIAHELTDACLINSHAPIYMTERKISEDSNLLRQGMENICTKTVCFQEHLEDLSLI